MPSPNTTRQQYVAQLQASYDASLKFGGNAAIKRHLDKVTAMADADWPAHRDHLNASTALFVSSGTAQRLAKQLARKMRKGA